jgi:hypothetical protein
MTSFVVAILAVWLGAFVFGLFNIRSLWSMVLVLLLGFIFNDFRRLRLSAFVGEPLTRNVGHLIGDVLGIGAGTLLFLY